MEEKTKVVYNNTTHTGKIEIVVNCKDEYEYLLSVENRKWLYPKLERLMFAAEHLIRADPTMVNQVNKVINKAFEDIVKLIGISVEMRQMK